MPECHQGTPTCSARRALSATSREAGSRLPSSRSIAPSVPRFVKVVALADEGAGTLEVPIVHRVDPEAVEQHRPPVQVPELVEDGEALFVQLERQVVLPGDVGGARVRTERLSCSAIATSRRCPPGRSLPALRFASSARSRKYAA